MSMNSYPMAPGQTQHAPPLSMWRRAGGLVFVSGHGAVDERGQFASEEFEAQYRYTMEQLSATLAEAGCAFADVVSVRCYIQHPSDLPAHNRLYRDYFSEPFPARTTVVSCLPPGLLFEIECIALAPEGAAP